MRFQAQQLNTATFVGIDAHPDSHTALAINRFQEPKGHVTFPNSKEGIKTFTSWLRKLETDTSRVIIGVEGGGNARNALLSTILLTHRMLFEVNPLYTKHKRSFGTKGDKTDLRDAKLVAGVLTTDLEDLPKIIPEQLSSEMLRLRKAVWYYEETSTQGTRLQNQLHKLEREHKLTRDMREKQLLSKIIKSRSKELDLIYTVKREMEKELRTLFPGYGQNLTSIRGIGVIISAQIVSHTSCIERIHSRDGFVRYAGIAPISRSSGKAQIFIRNNRGNRKLNTVLYMTALSRIRHDAAIKTLYQKQVATGKTKKEAVQYIMRKTAILVYAMMKSGEDYRS
jgi:Transposase and inactivated derivatives